MHHRHVDLLSWHHSGKFDLFPCVKKVSKTSIKKLYSLEIEMQVMSMLASLTKEGCNVTLAN